MRRGGEPFFEPSLRGGEEIFDLPLGGGEEIFDQICNDPATVLAHYHCILPKQVENAHSFLLPMNTNLLHTYNSENCQRSPLALAITQ